MSNLRLPQNGGSIHAIFRLTRALLARSLAMSDSVQLQLQVQLPFDFRMSIAQSVIEQAEQAGASYLPEIWSEKICF